MVTKFIQKIIKPSPIKTGEELIRTYEMSFWLEGEEGERALSTNQEAIEIKADHLITVLKHLESGKVSEVARTISTRNTYPVNVILVGLRQEGYYVPLTHMTKLCFKIQPKDAEIVTHYYGELCIYVRDLLGITNVELHLAERSYQ